jgi:site-specific DNA-methyltransferase (adenine-specific)
MVDKSDLRNSEMMETFGNVTLHNGDCMEVLKSLPDNAFDLAICDPPYGIGASEMTMGSGKNKQFDKGRGWDKSPPPLEYFQELKRVSKNQIIWGGNYFNLPLTKSWIVWDKGIYWDTSFADCEMAWTSFDGVARIAPIRYKGFLGADKVRIHPTQKPGFFFQKNYFKDSLLEQAEISRSALPNNCVGRDYNIFK